MPSRRSTTPPKDGRPADLGSAGTALWTAVTDDFEGLNAREKALLAAACRQADDVALLEGVIASDGVIVRGSMGQPRLSQVVAEVRQGRLALGRLLDLLALPESDESAGTGKSRRAQRAANHRWATVRAIDEAQDRAAEEAAKARPSGGYGPAAVRGG